MSLNPHQTVTQRPITYQDNGFLISLYQTTRERELEALQHCTEQQKQLFIKQQYDAQHHHYTHHYPTAQLNLLIRNTLPIGRLYIDRANKHIQLMDISLVPSMRNKGIGTYLIGHLINEAQRNICSLGLHVDPFNPALKLYQNLGFSLQEDLGTYHRMQWQNASCTSPNECNEDL